MSPYRAALLALVVVGSALVTAVPAGATSGVDATPDAVGATEAQVDATGVQTGVTGERVGVGNARPATDANDSTNNSSLGADISSFMQSSVAETQGAVETGMWTAEFNATENRTTRVKLVERRTSELRKELAELQKQKEELLAEREAGNISETAYKAKVSRLIGQINALQASINATSSRAKEVNANVEALSNLQAEVKNLTGPEIASVARNVTGVGNGAGGPPAGAGNGNGPDDAGNGTAGPPDDPGNNTTDADSRRGPPSDAGEAPMASHVSENGTSGGVPNGGAPAGVPAGNGSAAPADTGNSSAPIFSAVRTVTVDLVESVASLDPTDPFGA